MSKICDFTKSNSSLFWLCRAVCSCQVMQHVWTFLLSSPRMCAIDVIVFPLRTLDPNDTFIIHANRWQNYYRKPIERSSKCLVRNVGNQGHWYFLFCGSSWKVFQLLEVVYNFLVESFKRSFYKLIALTRWKIDESFCFQNFLTDGIPGSLVHNFLTLVPSTFPMFSL